MAERRKTPKSRKVQFSDDVNSEDAANRRAALENAIRKKIETERRAHQIVERLLESNITEDFLMDCAKFISPSYYKDVVEERSIVKICGYPICSNKLENVPKQRYKISTKTNKVYDITERKCFCSNFCYRASKYYEAQIPKTPVWSREEESGRSGEEVKLTERRIKASEIEKPKRTTEGGGSSSANSDEDGEGEQAFVSSVIPAPEQSHEDAELLPDSGNVTQEERTPDRVDLDQNLADTTERLGHCNLKDHEKTSDPRGDPDGQCPRDVGHGTEATEVVTEVTQRAVSKSGAEHLRKLLCKSKTYQATQETSVHPVVGKGGMLEVLTQTLNEWKSEETLQYLFGTDYVVEHKEHVPVATFEVQELDEDDLDLDNDITEDSSNSETLLNEGLPLRNQNRVSKPLPNYSKLREDTKMLEIRARQFFTGQYVLPEEVEHEQDGLQVAERKQATSWAPPLPLVDSCSQHQIRKRIVLEKLKKVFPAILMPLRITYSDVSKELHDLVKTFRFSSTNIIHTGPEWSIIAIVLLSALLPSMSRHKDSEKNLLYTKFISSLLEELHFQIEDLECLKKTFSSRTLSLSAI
ncbi:putative RNA polymerase II subunit B1 CTD phosphatase RPAP2 isoform X2 [Ranitomeya imitator]|uniref:putative RNA polymerase II subunit B1 CTD phosphatase RPAP2 isoform X2 n=1 Tax=Ranitomeya imitator TaxID=111125 RepID=UPI0037E738D7